jgi:hypothetical protein
MEVSFAKFKRGGRTAQTGVFLHGLSRMNLSAIQRHVAPRSCSSSNGIFTSRPRQMSRYAVPRKNTSGGIFSASTTCSSQSTSTERWASFHILAERRRSFSPPRKSSVSWRRQCFVRVPLAGPGATPERRAKLILLVRNTAGSCTADHYLRRSLGDPRGRSLRRSLGDPRGRSLRRSLGDPRGRSLRRSLGDPRGRSLRRAD